MNKVLMLFVGMVFFSSCSSSDENISEISYNVSLVGKWVISDYSDARVKNLVELDKLEPCSSKGSKIFINGNAGVDTYFHGEDCSEGRGYYMRYEVIGDVLITATSNNPGSEHEVRYNIKEMSNSKLVIQGFYVDDGISSKDPVLKKEEYFTCTYKKVEWP